MQSLVFLTYFFSEVVEENPLGDRLDLPPPPPPHTHTHFVKKGLMTKCAKIVSELFPGEIIQQQHSRANLLDIICLSLTFHPQSKSNLSLNIGVAS